MLSLFVGNLSSHVRHRELENAFRRFGRSNLELKDGFGFVVYEEPRDAERALKALQGRSICGEQPFISWAKRSRPFQRFSGKGNFVRRGSWDKYQSQATRRRPSLESDRGSDTDRREDKFLKDGSRASETREDMARIAREDEWKDPGPEKLVFEEEAKDVDPLDSGRWDPHTEGSPEHIMGDGTREDEDHLNDKHREDDRGNLHEKLQGSPVDKHHERSSRGYRNSFDQYKRGRDAAVGRPQERCYNCGQLGHVQRQCRSRPRLNNMIPRDGGYDGRRNELRYYRGGGGFRGMGGGRFRGSRRVFNRDMESSYARRNLRRHDSTGDRRHDSTGDRRHYDPIDTKSREKSRRRHHRSESPKDSSSRGRSKRKHKKSSKKSSRSTRKRRRSSLDSPSHSRSPQSSSSSPAGSRSCSRSGSRSHSVTSRSQSSKSCSQSSSSVSHSRPSRSQTSRSRSRSASSLSRSCSGSSRSRKSQIKSESQSSQSFSPRLSHSPGSHGVPSLSPKSIEANSSPLNNSKGGSRSPKHEEDREVGTTYKLAMGSELQEKQVSGRVIDEDMQENDSSKYSSEGQDSDQQYAKRKERRRLGSREAMQQKYQNRTDTEEPHYETGIQLNGGKRGSNSSKSSAAEPSIHQDTNVNEHYSRNLTGAGKVSLKGSGPPGQIPDTKCSIYTTIMKEDHRGVGGHDGGQELATESFGAGRLWHWEAMLYRRLKRGPISTANYETRKAQNEEFSIKDTFVRSSSGWWEKHSE